MAGKYECLANYNLKNGKTIQCCFKQLYTRQKILLPFFFINIHEIQPLTVSLKIMSHHDITHWFANILSEAERLVSLRHLELWVRFEMERFRNLTCEQTMEKYVI